MKEYNRFTASKRLSRIRPCIRSSYMSLDTIWCRVAYACLEDDSFFQNAHSFYELHYVTNGVQRIGIEDREPVLLNTGDLICIPPHSPHFTQHMNKETEKLVCGFSLSTENDWVSAAMRILCDGNIHSISAQTCAYVTLMLHAAHAQYTVSASRRAFHPLLRQRSRMAHRRIHRNLSGHRGLRSERLLRQ